MINWKTSNRASSFRGTICTALWLVALVSHVFAQAPSQPHVLPITITNHQSVATAAPFQQGLVVNSSMYSQYEAPDLRNIRFKNQSGVVIASWLESGASSTATKTLYWLNLPNGLGANSSITINMEFAGTTRRLFNRKTTGQAPELGLFYGQFDNGASVFTNYANFAGSTLPSGWYSGITAGDNGFVTISNGVSIVHIGESTNGISFLGSNWAVGDSVVDMYLTAQATSNGQAMVMGCSSDPAQFVWTPSEVGYQNGSGLEIEGNNGGTPDVLATASPDPVLPAVISLSKGTLLADYRTVATAHRRVCANGYLALKTNSFVGAVISFDWVRVRSAPPNGEMPVVTFGPIK